MKVSRPLLDKTTNLGKDLA